MSIGSPARQVRVLVVEDSPSMRDLLLHILGSDPQITVIGTAANGEEAIEAVKRDHPHVITMDVHMPGLNGFDATREIMETLPTPIVIVSGSSAADEVTSTFKALDAGALAFVAKPNGVAHPHHREEARQLIDTVKLMSEVKVVRRWPKRGAATATQRAPLRPASERVQSSAGIVAIGASTGGPIALKTILSELPKNFALPLLVVQHIAPGFTDGLADWLAQTSKFAVRVAVHGETPAPAQAYVAPDRLHMELAHDGTIALAEQAPENGHRPSVSHLFRSVAAVAGRNAIGVLLTGMGRDGADELKLMQETGAITIVQDRASSVIYGMPGEAINLGAARHVLPPAAIAALLAQLAVPAERRA
jgi:two-component system chemotaxis response regulator CheB